MGESKLECYPLYRWQGDGPQLQDTGHPGLWFDKFYNGWHMKDSEGQRDGKSEWTTEVHLGREKRNLKHEWLGGFVRQIASKVGSEARLRESAERVLRLVEAQGGRWRVLQTESRFVTGMGRQHPVENGFVWHHTLGVPYLPGSSVKGMVRAWAKVERVEADELNTLFGPDPQSLKAGEAQRGQGTVAFLDALPVEPPSLGLDVMTPHYANWTVDNLPGDWNSPTPIVFLTTEKAKFLFSVVPCGNDPDADLDKVEADLDRVMGWLEEALYWEGAGAKTAVGYGRMIPDQETERRIRRKHEERAAKEQEEAQKAERLAAMSPLERELEEVREEYPQFEEDQAFLAWLEAVRDGRWGDDPHHRLEVLHQIKVEMEQAGVWRLPSNPKQEKQKKFQRVVEVQRRIEETEAEIAGTLGEHRG